MTHAALIARLEALTGPDREVDEAVDRTVREWPALGGYYGWERFGPGVISKQINSDGSKFETMQAPRYTASLDAALTLVPEGKFFHMARFSDEAMGCDVHIYSTDAPTFETIGQAPTLPLALCIAALKAREASKP